MATRYAVGNGNFSSVSTWDNGATLGIPTTGDDVYANGFTINVDQSFNVATLRNTSLAAESTRLNPVMTSNTTPSGVSSASSSNGTALPWRAFDGSTVSPNQWESSGAVPQWIQYQFASSLIIRSYSIWYDAAFVGRPVNFNLQGSNDGVSFVTLDTRTGFVFTNGQYNTLTITNPTTAYSYYRLNITAVDSGNPGFRELTFNEAGASVAAGGSFNFNTAGVTGTVTSSNPLVPGATNMVQITATTGTVTLSLGGNVSIGITSANLINITGNCNVVLSGGYEFQVGTGSLNSNCINKTGNGTLTITGTLRPGNTNSGITNALNVTTGTVTVNGSVIGGNGTASNRGINATTNAVIIVNGNVNGGPGAGSGANPGIFATGVPITINGNVTGGFNSAAVSTDSTLIVTGAVSGGTSAGASAFGISTSGATTIINGNVTAIAQSAISSSSANIINVTGTVTASATANAITSTNANGQVYLNGNMVNNNGKMAIFAPIVWLDKNNTTSAAFFTSGGVARTLYSADTVPNQPAQNNVRFNTVYGPGNSLIGTCVMPVAANSRNGVVYDNGTVGTALFTTSQFVTELSSSTTPVAVRMQNLCTPMILGELMEAFKK